MSRKAIRERKRSRKAIPIDPRYVSELATPERARQMGGVRREQVPLAANSRATFTRDRAKIENILDVYKLRGGRFGIDAAQHAAGMKLRAVWIFDNDHNRPDSPGVRVDGGGQSHENLALMRVFANKTLKQAYEAVTLSQRSVLIDVCCGNTPAGNEYRMKLLRQGLDILARLWALTGNEWS